MKKLNIVAFLLLTIFLGCNENNSLVAADENYPDVQTKNMVDTINDLPVSTLSDTEKDGIIFMREEEKLARDVYLSFYEKYGMKIFNNIAKSESTHMASMKMLLDKYDLKDPVINDEIGIFQNEVLSNLYTQLTKDGDVNLLEALKVGATIEDLDIRDLMLFDDDVQSEDILLVYKAKF
jgi:hypothetical protein